MNAGNDFAGKIFVLTADIELSGNGTVGRLVDCNGGTIENCTFSGTNVNGKS